MQVSATTGPNGTAFRPRLFAVMMSSPKKKRRLIYSVVTRKVYNYVFIEVFGDQGPPLDAKPSFFVKLPGGTITWQDEIASFRQQGMDQERGAHPAFAKGFLGGILLVTKGGEVGLASLNEIWLFV
jgi:hypothetical protein